MERLIAYSVHALPALMDVPYVLQEVLKISDLLEQYNVPLKISSRASSEVINRGSEAVLDDELMPDP